MRKPLRWTGVSLLLLLVATLTPGSLPADEPFDYFSNSYNVIGLKDYEHGSRVTPANEILLSGKSKLRLRFGPRLTALGSGQIKTLLDGWLPVILLSATEDGVRYDFTFWSTPLPSVKDWREAFDWPSEGENFLNWINVKATNTTGKPVEAKARLERIDAAKPALAAKDIVWKLAPGASVEVTWRVPFMPLADPTAFDKEDPKLWLDRTVEFWRGLMSEAARIDVPCRKATEALLAAHVCQLIANDHGELQGGEGFYDNFYIRDGAYQIMELEEAGLWDASKKAVECYLRKQRPDGRFESQKGQLDANGQAPWVLWQYYKITGDKAWLARVYPAMRKSVDWTIKARRQTTEGPFAGLLPAAPADGEFLWDGKHHILGYDFWNLRAMLLTADAARELGKTDEAAELLAEAKLYRQAIDAAWKKTGLAHFPPSWEKAGTHWGNTETLWPTEIFDADDPRVAASTKEVRENHGGGYVEGTIQWLGHPDAIHPYMGAYTTMNCLVRGEHEPVVEDFYWYLLHSSASHAFPEGIYYKRRFAWSNTIPHVTGASNYAVMLRHMLVHEQGDELHLLAAVPDWWLDDGRQINIQRLPTHFGPMNLTVQGRAGGVEVKFDAPKRRPPERIVLHLPRSRPLVGSLEGVEVAVRTEQKKRWDFPSVVELYRQQMPQIKRIEGPVRFPLAEKPAADKCRAIDLAGVANTDPFSAPFGVPNPGKHLLFERLPTGKQTFCGVPFTVIDPAKNEGRGFVVLHSPRAPKNRAWPKQVELAVGGKARRAFFLGNVHGWMSHDPGTGPYGAVAEYVIHYAGGKKQIVPLVTGRTADEWAARPSADNVCVGYREGRLHLNVLGVTLEDLPIEKIVFRDLGTPCAPVLVGVTLEE